MKTVKTSASSVNDEILKLRRGKGGDLVPPDGSYRVKLVPFLFGRQWVPMWEVQYRGLQTNSHCESTLRHAIRQVLRDRARKVAPK